MGGYTHSISFQQEIVHRVETITMDNSIKLRSKPKLDTIQKLTSNLQGHSSVGSSSSIHEHSWHNCTYRMHSQRKEESMVLGTYTRGIR